MESSCTASSAKPPRRSRRKMQRRRARPDSGVGPPIWPGVHGGLYRPLSEADMVRFHHAALDILEQVGMSHATAPMRDLIGGNGGHIRADGRLLFPRSMVEDAIAGFRRDIVLYGQKPGLELELSGARVYLGTGGAAPSMVDPDTDTYRPSCLRDLYDAARLVDTLDNIHFFSRPVTARDMQTALDLDVNTAFACLFGTSKHVVTSVTAGRHVEAIADICEMIAGSKAAFAKRPFLSLNINHVIPPLRFSEAACGVMQQAVRLGLPFSVNSIDQAGASSPASLAGSVVQAVAETLAGMVISWLIDPHCRAIFGPRPMIADLRTGALTGGGGEQAAAMAAGVQMGQYYNLSNSCIAGATDSKAPDAQSGFEKALSVGLAAHAGSNMVTQACGMQATLMGCSLESYVIDNDMLGSILRSVRGIETDSDAISVDVFDQAVRGDGHYLGSADTMARMQSDFLYPEICDRRTADEWTQSGSPTIRDSALARTRNILRNHFPGHISTATEQAIRDRYDIHLPATVMGRGEKEKWPKKPT